MPPPVRNSTNGEEIAAPLSCDDAIACTPVVKWVGSKRSLAASLIARLPLELQPSLYNHGKLFRYIEPFFGSGAVFLRLRAIGWRGASVLGDLNDDLCTVYREIQRSPQNIRNWLDLFEQGHCKEKYYLVRDAWNGTRDGWPLARRAAGFIYLNKACFNGLWRVNASGAFNVPFNNNKKLSLPTLATLVQMQRALVGAAIEPKSFVDTMTLARAGDVIYCDPPYIPTSATSSFTAYAGNFGIDEQTMLASVAREMVKRGVFVMLSNSNSPLAWSLYPDDVWMIDHVTAPRKVAADGARRADVTELVITPKVWP